MIKVNNKYMDSMPTHCCGAFNISKIQDESKSQRDNGWKIFRSGAFNISKIQDESKSQPLSSFHFQVGWCFQYFKDTRWKQITTLSTNCRQLYGCFQYFKDTRWKQITTYRMVNSKVYLVLSIFQRYKMKANHNHNAVVYWNFVGAFNISKIQDESKSQPIHFLPFAKRRCFQYFKDTRWKQITTM